MIRLLALPILSMLALPGCVAATAGHPAVPPVLAEDVPAPPPTRVALIWRPGHYEWSGRTYAWIRGEWVSRAGHGTLWQDGYWRRIGAAEVWMPAHWI